MSSPPASDDQIGTGRAAKYAGLWDRLAEGYSAKPIADPAAYERKLAITKARLRPNDVLLDVGCGTGSLALELAPLVARVDAVDLSKEMVRIANGKAAAAGVDNVTFHHASAEGLSVFGQGRFDVITAYNILHLVDDVDATLAKLYGLLAAGGTFIASTPCLREGWVPYGPIITVMRWLGKAPPVTTLRRAEVLAAIGDAGFVDVRDEPVTDNRAVLFSVARKPTK